MLTFNLKRILAARGISRPHKFLTTNGFSPSYATRLINNDIRSIQTRQLEKLCTVLHCTPNDLLQWQPEKGKQPDPKHPLYSLLKEESKMSEALLTAPIDKLKDVENFVLGLKEKSNS